MVIFDLIARGAERYPQKPALVFGREAYSYQKLFNLVNRLASGLMEAGLEPGDRLAILMRNRPEFILLYLASQRAGAVPVPLNYFWKEEELRFVLADCQPRFLGIEPHFLEIGKRLQQRLPFLEQLILTEETSEPDRLNLKTFLQKPLKPPPSAAETAVILYTSGTTGFPKGVVLTHRNLLADVASCCQAVRLFRRDRFLSFLPLFHSFSFTVCVLVPFSLGATIFLDSTTTPFKKLIQRLLRHRITIFVAIPDIYRLLSEVRLPFWPRFTLRLTNPIRLAVSGAASLAPETFFAFQRRFRTPLIEGYGLTEAAPVVTLNPVGKAKPGSIGIPLPGISVKLVSDEGQEIKAIGVVGELLVRGENVMSGYYNRTIETAAALKEGWLYTGDLAQKDADGYLYLMGRKSEMINFRGLNIYPVEVEAVLYRHPAVEEAAVVGKRTAAGEFPIAYVVLKKGVTTTPEDLKHYLGRFLADYKIPRRFIFRQTLPHTATGKIAKKELKEKELKK